MEGLTGSISKIFGAEFHKNELKTMSLMFPRSAKFCTKSLIEIWTVHHFFSNSCYSSNNVSHSNWWSPAAHLTHCLPFTNPQELGMESTDIGKSVRVKFQIQIECQFGDHLLIVGDDLILGSWNPSDAIPFNWSEGHMWSLVLEMPVEKTFRYKFLLKQRSGEILWQPGPDRVFQSWETENIIVVSEEWADAEAQKISEEQQNIDENEELIGKTLVDPSVIGLPMHLKQDVTPIVADNIGVSSSDVNVRAETVNRDRSMLNVEDGAHSNENTSSSANATKKGRSSDTSPQKKVRTRKGSLRGVGLEQSSAEAEDEGSLAIYDEGLVLVPGLTVSLIPCEKVDAKIQQKSLHADTSPGVDASKKSL